MLVSDLPVNHKIISRLTTKGITELTSVQKETILPALLGKDIIASSKTGSGKTFAFLIPALHRLISTKALSRQDPRAVILAPTRELAKQVFIEAKSLSQGLGLKCQLIVGGENYNDQVKVLKRNPEIIVGTAGRIADHLSDRSFFINGLELLIFDEADRMLDLGFSTQLKQINEAANHRKRQTMLFSATLDDIELNYFTKDLLKAPVRVAIGSSSEQHKDIVQKIYFADSVDNKDQILKHTLTKNDYNQAIVFTATRDDTQRISSMLVEGGIQAVALRGDFAQNQRAAIMNEFSVGQHSVLVTTDVASRGLDLKKVGLVINYDLPKHAEEYIHRIGRTGRAGNKGIAFSLVGKRDWKAYELIVDLIDYDLIGVQHEEFPSSFNGFSRKTKSLSTNKTSRSTKNNKVQSRPKIKPRINTMKGEEVGHRPVKKKILPDS